MPIPASRHPQGHPSLLPQANLHKTPFLPLRSPPHMLPQEQPGRRRAHLSEGVEGEQGAAAPLC